jgi:isoleucyl-tRNA synthetase
VEIVQDSDGPLLRAEVKLNLRVAGAKLGSRLKEAQTALAAEDHIKVASGVQSTTGFVLNLADGPETLTSADVLITYVGPEGWSGVADRDTQVALDARITPELAREGMARDIVRQIQDLRKRAGLEMEDRIALELESPHEELAKAIEEHRASIAAETLTASWTTGGTHVADVRIDSAPLIIRLDKITT